MSEELLPCPGYYVGEAHNLAIYDYTSTGSADIGLAYVKCSCGWRGRDGDSVPNAIKAWNTRPESKPYKYATYMRAYEVDTSFFEGSFEAGFNAARELKEG